MVLGILNLFENVHSILGLKREIAAHENVQQNSHWPTVDLAIIVSLLSILNLWSHIIGCPCDRFKFLSWLLSFRKSKINQFQLVIFREHNILWLDVSVDHSLSVHVAERPEELLGVNRSCLFRKNLIFWGSDFVKKFTASDVLHDEVDIFFIDVCFIILHDIWMVEFCEDLHLFLDSIQVILKFLFVHYLDCHFVFWVWNVVGKKNFTECTLSENFCVVVDEIVQF